MTLGTEISSSATVQQAINVLMVAVRHEAKQAGVIAVDLLAIADEGNAMEQAIASQISGAFDTYYSISGEVSNARMPDGACVLSAGSGDHSGRLQPSVHPT